MYVDGHEHSDVIEEREAFLKQLATYEWYVACNQYTPCDHTEILIHKD